MARNIVDIALVEFNGIPLTTVRSWAPKSPNPSAPVKTMNSKRRAIGYTRGVPDFSGDLDVVIPVGTPEVDWREYKRLGTTFLFSWTEASGGKRRSFIDCRVNECSPTFDEGGETKISVSIVALDERAEN
jgi:hypothetical protein